MSAPKTIQLDYVEPTGEEIKAVRIAAGLTPIQAAELLDLAISPAYVDKAGVTKRGPQTRVWPQWESGERQMPRSLWQLFLLATSQHKTLKLTTRRDPLSPD